MKKALIIAGLFGIVFSTGCKRTDEKKDTVSIEGDVKEVRFAPDNMGPQYISITSNTDWHLSVSDTWVSVTPEAGEAGDADLTVAVVDEECNAARTAEVIITAGTAEVSFKVVQEAPVKVESIGLSAAQRRIVVGQTLPLEITYSPEDAFVEDVQFSSSDDAVASVDQEGTVTAVSVGNAVITAAVGGLEAEYALEVTEEFTTDGLGTEYTFDMLSGLPAGIVTEWGENIYRVNADMTVAEGDALVIDGVRTLLIADGVRITVMGNLDFSPSEQASIQPENDDAVPEYLYFTGNGGGIIRNMRLVCFPIRNFGAQTLTIEECELTGVVQDYAAVNLGSEALSTVRNCEITDNVREAISGGANIASPLLFQDNKLKNNSYDSRNRPQINVTVGGEGSVEIIGNEVVGPYAITTNGGIAVANMMNLSGSNKVLIEDNQIHGNRYGITTNGVMDVTITDNKIYCNTWDSNPMSGGSGISIYNSAGGQKAYISGNVITDNLWGITIIGNVAGGTGPEVNLGNLTEGDDYNPGKNHLAHNGNNGVSYDLYNNSPMMVYAQNNRWGVIDHIAISIEEVIFHQYDDPSLGEVIYMPPWTEGWANSAAAE